MHPMLQTSCSREALFSSENSRSCNAASHKVTSYKCVPAPEYSYRRRSQSLSGLADIVYLSETQAPHTARICRTWLVSITIIERARTARMLLQTFQTSTCRFLPLTRHAADSCISRSQITLNPSVRDRVPKEHDVPITNLWSSYSMKPLPM
jgi:hypothetical protein